MKNKQFFLLVVSSFASASFSMEKDDQQRELTRCVESLPVEIRQTIGQYYLKQIFATISSDPKEREQSFQKIMQQITTLSKTNKEAARYFASSEFFDALFKKLGITSHRGKIIYAIKIGTQGALDYITALLAKIKKGSRVDWEFSVGYSAGNARRSIQK